MHGCCLLTSAQHSTPSFPPSWPLNSVTWVLTPPSATGLWTFWPTDLSMLGKPYLLHHHHTQHRHATGLCAEPIPLLPLHPWLQACAWIQLHHQFCRWHHGDWPHQRQQWDCLQVDYCSHQIQSVSRSDCRSASRPLQPWTPAEIQTPRWAPDRDIPSEDPVTQAAIGKRPLEPVEPLQSWLCCSWNKLLVCLARGELVPRLSLVSPKLFFFSILSPIEFWFWFIAAVTLRLA